jgi:hypothetical protein
MTEPFSMFHPGHPNFDFDSVYVSTPESGPILTEAEAFDWPVTVLACPVILHFYFCRPQTNVEWPSRVISVKIPDRSGRRGRNYLFQEGVRPKTEFVSRKFDPVRLVVSKLVYFLLRLGQMGLFLRLA